MEFNETQHKICVIMTHKIKTFIFGNTLTETRERLDFQKFHPQWSLGQICCEFDCQV